ncbi:MAG: DUF3034 family protein [Erythrobacter sp.]|nr:DUF3034 family protein [Erythrobacter sp.]
MLVLCQAAAGTAAPLEAPAAPQIAYAKVLEEEAAAVTTAPAPIAAAPTIRALQPLGQTSAVGDSGIRIGKLRAFEGGKLLLTNGISTVEGGSGGGIASWATIAGRQTPGGIGVSGHVTAIELPDFGWRSYGAAIGFGDRLELSFARADFDTRDAGALLGLGQGYTFNQETYGAKLRVAGDLVYGEAWLPQIAVGIEHKRNRDGGIVRALGAADDSGTDYTLSATKLLLARSLLVNATLRYTEANQLGLLGFGSAAGAGYRVQFEGSLGYQLSRRAVIGAEYRSKPDNLGLGEDDWMDLFAAYAVTDHVTLGAAYADLGSIATFSDQRGGFLSAQIAF